MTRRLTTRQREVERKPLRIRLTLDDGLASWVRAYVKGIGLYGDERATIIAFVRRAIIEDSANDGFRSCMLPHLPPDIRRAMGHKK